jgi:ADP-ribosyl-[dinitrogen reductase] hydrolase
MTHDKLLSCLLGGAVGDALGAPVEFLSLKAIRQEYGPDGTKLNTSFIYLLRFD